MENKHEDWIDALREAAAPDGGEELPAGLWERISASLDAVPPPIGASPPHPPVRRRRFYVRAASAAAAAVVAVAAGVFMLVTLTNDPDGGDIPLASVPAEIETSGGSGNDAAGFAETEPAAGVAPERDIAEARAVSETSVPRRGALETAQGGAAAPAAESGKKPAAPVAAVESESGDEPDVAAPDAVEEGKKGSGDVPPAVVRETPLREYVRTASFGKAPSRRGMLALSASGGASVSGGLPQNTPMQNSPAALVPNREGQMVMAVRTPQYTYRHRQPLTFAVSVDFGVGRNLFAGAGVSYTRLSSTATDDRSGQKFEQLIQYAGIPLTFKWAFLNSGLFMLYTGAEAQAEFCVDARFDGRREDIRTMQLSVHALAGAQLNLGRRVGIYAEPKLSHYFLDTELETVRNSRGVNFNMQFGLRFSY